MVARDTVPENARAPRDRALPGSRRPINNSDGARSRWLLGTPFQRMRAHREIELFRGRDVRLITLRVPEADGCSGHRSRG
ncbi:hypothetical protein NDU88_007601 [Pleurodeles waltl]|uniref:Uncharacterized protein n=1 Tax=Pleurodeles waltl TaxID=8319 RepID=A0AAV7N3W9_PLEWA|nr:hypothetical protein NDU88_007601 [Pleurodeles waltl]